jgi:hypothetical protein
MCDPIIWFPSRFVNKLTTRTRALEMPIWEKLRATHQASLKILFADELKTHVVPSTHVAVWSVYRLL